MNISVLQKHVVRNTLWIVLLIIFFVMGMTAGRAFASEPQTKLSLSVPEKPSKRPELKILPSITTTTTTTLKPKPRPQTIATQKAVPITQGAWIPQCKTWMTQAGIPPEVHDIAIALIDRESDCGATAQNPNSTAYGIGQFLDSTWKGVGCVKTSEPVEQLRCMALYVVRHGGWQGSLTFRINEGWY